MMKRIDRMPSLSALKHPREAQTMLSCQKNVLFDQVARFAGGLHANAQSIPDMLLTGYLITEKTALRVYRIYKTVLENLNAPKEFPLFVDFGYELTPQTYGAADGGCIIVLSSACVTELTDDELAALLGMEVAHILMDHTHNNEIISVMDSIAQNIPMLGTMVGQQLTAFFAKWIFASAYSADRAALIACGSVKAVVSLLLKQMGVNPDEYDLDALKRQKIEDEPKILGIYFIWMARKMYTLGAMRRIHELLAWIGTEAFRQEYPHLYYSCRLELGKWENDIHHAQQCFLHQKAINGDVKAQTELARAYLFGEKNIPQSFFVGMHYLKEASFRGSAESMLLLGSCLMHDSQAWKADEELARRLFYVSSTMGSKAGAEAASRYPAEMAPVRAGIYEACQYAVQRSARGWRVQIADQSQGMENIQALRSRLFIPADEKIYAAEWSFFGPDTGLVIAGSGIYGQCDDDLWPFYIPWGKITRVTTGRSEDKYYLCCGSRRISRMIKGVSGTAGELLVKILQGK